MSKKYTFSALMFCLGLLISSVGGTAYLHMSFASQEYVREVKDDLKEHLNRIEKKIDTILDKR